MSSGSEARVRSWAVRRAKYGPSGQAPWVQRTGRTGPRPKLSDRVSDAEYLERLKAKCKVMPNGCWEFQGFCGEPPRNYGHHSYRGKRMPAHRVAYTTAKGPIPKGMVVMHVCDNPPCCNPSHLRLGTHLDNMSECRAKGRYHYANLTQCKRGHEFNDANTYYIKTPGPSLGLRACKVCQRGRARVKKGWPEHLAYSEIIVPYGYTVDFETGAIVSTKARRNKATGSTVNASQK